MALSSKEKKGIGYLITAALFAVVGIFTLMAGIPLWIPIIFDAIILVAGGLGIYAIVKPDA